MTQGLNDGRNPTPAQFADANKILNAIVDSGVFTEADKVVLAELLGNETLRRALRMILCEADAQGTLLIGIDLTDEKERGNAIRMQGIATGLTRAVEMLLDATQTFDEQDNQGKEGSDE